MPEKDSDRAIIDQLSERDRQAIQSARAKPPGAKLTTRENNALEKFKRLRDIQIRREAYSAVPEVEFAKMARRQVTQIRQAAVARGLPMGNGPVNLYQWVAAALDIISTIRKSEEDARSPALERLRSAQAAREEIALALDQKSTVKRSDVHESFALVSKILKETAANLAKRHGPEAGEVLDDAITEMKRAIDQRFGSGDDEPAAMEFAPAAR